MIIKSNTVLPAIRENIVLKTSDGYSLIGEHAYPISGSETVIVTLHPLPTQGGFMDSHIIRKASNRLPALANTAILRFNTRGTESPLGKSEGFFDDGNLEKYDLEAAIKFVLDKEYKNIWLLGWSFGTEIALKHAHKYSIKGLLLLSPPLRRVKDSELNVWKDKQNIVIKALIPEHDDFLKPSEAMEKFSALNNVEVIEGKDAKHLWVGEKHTYWVLNKIVEYVNPRFYPLPETFH